MNVDRSTGLDEIRVITDIRSVGTVMIEMLTRTKIGDAEPLKLPSEKLHHSIESYKDCESFLELASRKETDPASYSGLLLLLEAQLSTWDNMLSNENQLKRSQELSYEVGLKQPSVL